MSTRLWPSSLLPGWLVLLALGSCVGAPPVPDDRYYRLPAPVVADSRAAKTLKGGLWVAPTSTSGIQRERALLYSDDSEHLRVRPYRYVFWAQTPAETVQRWLSAWLTATAAAAPVSAHQQHGLRYRLGSHLHRFERRLDPNGASAAVVLEVWLTEPGSGSGPLHHAEYREQVAARSNEMSATVAAFAQAMERIGRRLVDDLARLPHDMNR